MDIKYGYGGKVLKAKGEAYIGIHKDVVKKFMGKASEDDKWKMYLVFDIANKFLNFATSDECSKGEEPKFPRFKNTKPGRELLEQDSHTPVRSNFLYLKPFYVRMSVGAALRFQDKVFWAHGKINKSAKFNLPKAKDANGEKIKGEGVSNFKSLKEILGSSTVWCLCPQELRNRSLAVTNAEELSSLSREERLKCRTYISITKAELFPITQIPFMEECVEIYKNEKKPL